MPVLRAEPRRLGDSGKFSSFGTAPPCWTKSHRRASSCFHRGHGVSSKPFSLPGHSASRTASGHQVQPAPKPEILVGSPSAGRSGMGKRFKKQITVPANTSTMEGSCGWVIEWRKKRKHGRYTFLIGAQEKSILIIIFWRSKRYALCGSSD